MEPSNLIPPVIDIAPLLKPELHAVKSVELVQQQICQACETWGFFHVTSHGIPDELQTELQRQMALFFQAAPEVKGAVRRTADNSRGWADDELTKQLRDVKQVFDVGGAPPRPDLPANAPENSVLDGFNQWPSRDALPHFQSTVSSYFDECTRVSRTLLAAVVAGLGPDAQEVIEPAFDQHTSFLRLNYYPVAEGGQVDAGNLGVSRHTDAGALTLILQDSTAALEVWSGTKQDAGDGAWVPVDPVPGALTINTGDMLMVWSNGRFKAPEHRVRAMTSKARYSAPFFYNPDYKASVAPLLAPGAAPKYRPIVWGEFRLRRFAGDYSDVGREIQIEDFLMAS